MIDLAQSWLSPLSVHDRTYLEEISCWLGSLSDQVLSDSTYGCWGAFHSDNAERKCINLSSKCDIEAESDDAFRI